MSVSGGQKANKSLLTVLWANTWALNFILFALLADIAYRSIVLQEPAWDLFALIGACAVIIIGYTAWHKTQLVHHGSWSIPALAAVAAIIAAAIGAILTVTKAM